MNETKDKQLPLSIKLIGWYHIVGSAALTALIFISVFGIIDIFSMYNIEPTLTVMIITYGSVTLFAVGLYFLGTGILAKKQSAWSITIFLSVMSIIVSSFVSSTTLIVEIGISLLIIWTLLVHKRIFNI